MASPYRSAITKFAKRHGPTGDTKYDIHPKPVPGQPNIGYYPRHRKKPSRPGVVSKIHPKRIA